MSKERIDLAAEMFRVMSHPVRLQLLAELSREEECVCHLAALLDRPQPYVSQQLAELREAGLVTDRREGQRIFYQLVDDRVRSLLEAAGVKVKDPRVHIAGCACPKCA